MASSKEEIVKRIKEQFVENSILQNIYGLTGVNTFDEEFSLTSLEAQIIEVAATLGKSIYDIFEIQRQEIESILQSMTPGTLDWYKRLALGFQDAPHVLEWDPLTMRYKYAEDDIDAQIIKVASVNEENNKLIMKVAKLDANNNPQPLSSTQLLAFREDYMERLKYAGVLINYISTTPDDVNIGLKIYYNPAVLNSNGSLISNPSVYPVADAIKEYLHLTPFNGLFNITDMIDKLQVTPGVVNPIFESAEAKHGSNLFSSITSYYRPYSGYMRINNLNVTYTPAI